jgi:hypothetical protein
MVAEADFSRIAFYERERKGIFIHADLLRDSPFRPGDRFVLWPKPAQLFSVTLARDASGGIFFDQHGIFVARTRRIDILMGGIFDRYVVSFDPQAPDRIRIRPLDVVRDSSQRWV